MDGTNIQTYQNRGTGTGILGTSLGVDAIGEFQVLTNTYGAQYGGNGSVLNSVTRSGTNAFHGSLYEFTRNSRFDRGPVAGHREAAVLEASEWRHDRRADQPTDRMFFFANFEYLKQNETQSLIRVVPNALAREGIIPLAAGAAPAPGCVVATIAGHQNCGMGTAEPGQLPASEAVPGSVPARSQPAGQRACGRERSPGTRAPASAIRWTRETARRRSSSTRNRPGPNTSRWGALTGTSRTRTTCSRATSSTTRIRRSRFTATIPAWPELEDSHNQYFTIGEKTDLLGHVDQLDPVRLHPDLFQHPQPEHQSHPDAWCAASRFA